MKLGGNKQTTAHYYHIKLEIEPILMKSCLFIQHLGANIIILGQWGFFEVNESLKAQIKLCNQVKKKKEM